MELTDQIFELIKKTSTSLPEDVNQALMNAPNKGLGMRVMSRILENVELAEKKTLPICQDTGIPIFYVMTPENEPRTPIIQAIVWATNKATKAGFLRPNSIDALTGIERGNMPQIHFSEGSKLRIYLLLKGGGSENVSAIYKLPNTELKADRNLEGVKACVLDAVFKAQGRGCPPYFIGVAFGGDMAQVAHESKRQLLRPLQDQNNEKQLTEFENSTLRAINKLGIGPQGMGGRVTALSVKAIGLVRHPASFFVGVSINCWALRRRML